MSVLSPWDDGVRVRRCDHAALQCRTAAFHFASTDRTARDPRRYYTAHTVTYIHTYIIIIIIIIIYLLKRQYVNQVNSLITQRAKQHLHNANDVKTFLKHFSDCLFYFCSTCADSIWSTTSMRRWWWWWHDSDDVEDEMSHGAPATVSMTLTDLVAATLLT